VNNIIQKYCAYCGTKLRENAKFCEGCGKTPLSEEELRIALKEELKIELTNEIRKEFEEEQIMNKELIWKIILIIIVIGLCSVLIYSIGKVLEIY